MGPGLLGILQASFHSPEKCQANHHCRNQRKRLRFPSFLECTSLLFLLRLQSLPSIRHAPQYLQNPRAVARRSLLGCSLQASGTQKGREPSPSNSRIPPQGRRAECVSIRKFVCPIPADVGWSLSLFSSPRLHKSPIL